MKTGKITVQDLNIPLEWLKSRVAENQNKSDLQPLNDTVDYAELSNELVKFIQDSQFQLVETLVYRSAEKILQKSPKISAAWVRIQKTEAIPGAKGSIAEIKLERSAV